MLRGVMMEWQDDFKWMSWGVDLSWFYRKVRNDYAKYAKY